MLVAGAGTDEVTRACATLGVPTVNLLQGRQISVAVHSTPTRPRNRDDTAMVLMTSGSTGTPKVVPLHHRQVCLSAQDVARSLSLGPSDV